MTHEARYAFLLNRARDMARHAHIQPREGLPQLYFFTDPIRTPNPEAIAVHLPEGSAIVYRHFGASDADSRAQTLQAIARERKLHLLIGNDPERAVSVGASGIHLPESRISEAPGLRAACPHLWLTAACHHPEGLAQVKALDAVFVSPVFRSRSPSATEVPPLNLEGVQAFCAVSPVPVMGLGGITADNAHKLTHSGLSGFGAVDAFQL